MNKDNKMPDKMYSSESPDDNADIKTVKPSDPVMDIPILHPLSNVGILNLI